MYTGLIRPTLRHQIGNKAPITFGGHGQEPGESSAIYAPTGDNCMPGDSSSTSPSSPAYISTKVCSYVNTSSLIRVAHISQGTALPWPSSSGDGCVKLRLVLETTRALSQYRGPRRRGTGPPPRWEPPLPQVAPNSAHDAQSPCQPKATWLERNGNLIRVRVGVSPW